jgi:cytochrome c peroxidase
MSARAALVLLAALGGACSARVPLDGAWTPEELELILSLSPPAAPLLGPGNPVADDERTARLGQRLFFDATLSQDGTRSCASCHQPERYFTDGLALARGLRTLARNTPSILGASGFAFLTWDGRKDSLWSQALAPIEDAREQGLSRTAAARRLAEAYRPEYERLFGPLPPVEDTRRFPPGATPLGGPEARAAWEGMAEEDRLAVDRAFSNMGKALEAYQRRLWPGRAPFDRYVEALRGGDPAGGGHLSEEARRGLRLFLGQGRCVSCHHGPLLSDGQFHNLGLPLADPLAPPDEGRARGAREVKADPFRCGGPYSATATCDELRFLDPSFEDFLGAFRTPSLRNVARTAPYMHAGQLRTLEEVLAFYRSLPGQPALGHRDPLLTQIPRTLPTRPLVAFLESLTGPLPPAEWLAPPASPPPGRPSSPLPQGSR